jgi:hypothetical protein
MYIEILKITFLAKRNYTQEKHHSYFLCPGNKFIDNTLMKSDGFFAFYEQA